MDEYVGCKLERNYEERSMKFMQPVMLQSFAHKFDWPGGPLPNTPATPGDALAKAKPEDCVTDMEQFKYCSGTGKLVLPRNLECSTWIVKIYVRGVQGTCEGHASYYEVLHQHVTTRLIVEAWLWLGWWCRLWIWSKREIWFRLCQGYGHLKECQWHIRILEWIILSQ